MTSSLTQSFNSCNFSSLVLPCEATTALMADELISGRSTSTTLLSIGILSGKSSYPLRQKTMKAFSWTSLSALPQRCREWRMSPPITKQNLVSKYFFLSSLRRSQVWMGRFSALLSWISSSETLICGCFSKMVLMRWNRFSMGSNSFLSSLSPHGISHTSSMPSIFPKWWISFRWPTCGGSKAPPYMATAFIIDINNNPFSRQEQERFIWVYSLDLRRQAMGLIIVWWMQQAKKSDKYDYMAKVIIIGDSGVGKTNLITRFCENAFKDSYVATIGVDFKIKTMLVNNRKFRLQIWDTAGQERFKNITQTYYKGAAGIILAYSITDRTSFQNIERWITQIDNNAPAEVSKVLLATKNDLQDERSVTTEEGMALSQRFKLQFMEVSAKTGTNVKEAFQMLVKEIHCKFETKGEFEGLSIQKEVVLGKSEATTAKKNCSC